MELKLQVRDKTILHILAGLGVSRALDLSFLAGFNNDSYARRRIAYLQKNKLIASDYIGREKVYYLTSKGYIYTERYRANYQINTHTIHDIGVARICTYLYLTKEISYKDLLTDRQMFYLLKNSSIHRPDVVLESTCYEYERTCKNLKYLKRNMQENQKFDKQIWIIHNTQKRLKKNILEIADKNFITNVELVFFEDIDSFVHSFDLAQNNLRIRPVLGKRNYALLLQPTTNEDDFNSYFNSKEVF